MEFPCASCQSRARANRRGRVFGDEEKERRMFLTPSEAIPPSPDAPTRSDFSGPAGTKAIS